jgi:hypothetical protein
MLLCFACLASAASHFAFFDYDLSPAISCAAMSFFGYAPQPAQPGYAPQTPQPGYAPQPDQPGYAPQPPQAGYADRSLSQAMAMVGTRRRCSSSSIICR